MYLEEYGRNIEINWDKRKRYPVRSFREAIEVIRSLEPINGYPSVTFGIGERKLASYGISFYDIPEGACKIERFSRYKVFLLDGSVLEFENEFKKWSSSFEWSYIRDFFSESK